MNPNPVSTNEPITALVKSGTGLLHIIDSGLEMDPIPQLILDLPVGSSEHLLMEM
jgi:hypothetical protein